MVATYYDTIINTPCLKITFLTLFNFPCLSLHTKPPIIDSSYYKHPHIKTSSNESGNHSPVSPPSLLGKNAKMLAKGISLCIYVCQRHHTSQIASIHPSVHPSPPPPPKSLLEPQTPTPKKIAYQTDRERFCPLNSKNQAG